MNISCYGLLKVRLILVGLAIGLSPFPDVPRSQSDSAIEFDPTNFTIGTRICLQPHSPLPRCELSTSTSKIDTSFTETSLENYYITSTQISVYLQFNSLKSSTTYHSFKRD